MTVPSCKASKALGDLLDGLRIRTMEGWVFLDRPAAVRFLASATLRGLAGHLLAAQDRTVVDRWFKPGDGGNTPSALLFQPVHRAADTAPAFPFRIVTWDREGELIEALRSAFRAAPGWPFGESGAMVASVRAELPESLVFEGGGWDDGPVRIDLETPLKLRRHRRWLDAGNLGVPDLVGGMVRRLCRLSQEYGNGRILDEAEWQFLAAPVRLIESRLRDVAPARRSSTQMDVVSLAGVVGPILAAHVSPPVADLLLTGAVFHLGKHTTEGCGWVNIRPV